MVLQRFGDLLMIWIEYRPPSPGIVPGGPPAARTTSPGPVHLKFDSDFADD